jgi:glucosamine-6-phosphate deaminase
MAAIDRKSLVEWCRVPVSELEHHQGRKIPLRLVDDSPALGRLMAGELVEGIEKANRANSWFRAIIPCGPSCWYLPFVKVVNDRRLSLKRFAVFHMDECLDWQGHTLPRKHPYSFRGTMEREFYDPVDPALAVPEENRHWLTPSTMENVAAAIAAAPIDLTLGGWGQDGHLAYNQARRNPWSPIDVEDLRASTIRFQENNADTIVALSHRTFGGAWQLVPPLSITLGMKECLSARRVRLFSDTGAWKQTALRVALFGPESAEYPITLLQSHPDALLTATRETATHPLSVHPEWDLGA